MRYMLRIHCCDKIYAMEKITKSYGIKYKDTACNVKLHLLE